MSIDVLRKVLLLKGQVPKTWTETAKEESWKSEHDAPNRSKWKAEFNIQGIYKYKHLSHQKQK